MKLKERTQKTSDDFTYQKTSVKKKKHSWDKRKCIFQKQPLADVLQNRFS